MSINRYLRAYRAQRSNAERRGIEFLLTFKEWCDFWGGDVNRRGNGPDDLQMQRFGDSGPYAIWNIKKGHPKQNGITRGNVQRAKNTEKLGKLREAELDSLMDQESGEDKWLDDDAHELAKLGFSSMDTVRYKYAADK